MLPVCHVPVGWVGEEELPLGGHGQLDVLPALDILLRTVHDPDISSPAPTLIVRKIELHNAAV